MEEEGEESRKNRKEQERERRRLRDRERRQFMSQDERERHLARRRKNYQLRRQRAEINRIHPTANMSTTGPLAESDDQSGGIPMKELAKLMGTIRLSRVKHLARTLCKSSTAIGIEAINNEATNAMTKRAMSSGLRLSRVKRLVRSKGQQEEHSQTQEGVQLCHSSQLE